jgi:hypothetical protein
MPAEWSLSGGKRALLCRRHREFEFRPVGRPTNCELFSRRILGDEPAPIWNAPRKTIRGRTQKRLVEWAFLRSLMVVDTERVESCLMLFVMQASNSHLGFECLSARQRDSSKSFYLYEYPQMPRTWGVCPREMTTGERERGLGCPIIRLFSPGLDGRVVVSDASRENAGPLTTGQLTESVSRESHAA